MSEEQDKAYDLLIEMKTSVVELKGSIEAVETELRFFREKIDSNDELIKKALEKNEQDIKGISCRFDSQIKELDNRVAELEKRDGEKATALIQKIFYLVLTGVIGYIGTSLVRSFKGL